MTAGVPRTRSLGGLTRSPHHFFGPNFSSYPPIRHSSRPPSPVKSRLSLPIRGGRRERGGGGGGWPLLASETSPHGHFLLHRGSLVSTQTYHKPLRVSLWMRLLGSHPSCSASWLSGHPVGCWATDRQTACTLHFAFLANLLERSMRLPPPQLILPRQSPLIHPST